MNNEPQEKNEGANQPCTLNECPPGLFRFNGELGFKSEYGRNNGQCDAYCVSTGEYFWGGASGDAQKRGNLIVEPISDIEEEVHRTSYPLGYKDGWRDGRDPLNNRPVAPADAESIQQHAVDILAEFHQWREETGPCPIGITGPWSNKLARLCYRLAESQLSPRPTAPEPEQQGEATPQEIYRLGELAYLSRYEVAGGGMEMFKRGYLDGYEAAKATPDRVDEGRVYEEYRNINHAYQQLSDDHANALEILSELWADFGDEADPRWSKAKHILGL